ncbi:MAG: hypothetical protein JWN47_3374, partial [Frankiales bacterium]|nr:hypothetical protein [Frankiales bacterium]
EECRKNGVEVKMEKIDKSHHD